MEKYVNPMELFKQERPEVDKAFDGPINAVSSSEGLDRRCSGCPGTHYLGQGSQGDQGGVVDAILMTLTVSGINGVVTCLPESIRVGTADEEGRDLVDAKDVVKTRYFLAS